MLIRYRTSEEGKHIAKALVYTADEHRIDRSKVDIDALRIIERLRENGHEAYIVGGAVRDLLLGIIPKDFDIVTDAQPPRIKRIFRNARVIGRRFRLVHVYAGPKIFEVSTFRSISQGTIGNEYGSIDEDALRRDFTCNALFYDPTQGQLVDYVSGFKHISARRIVPVIPLKSIFVEDPVRMIRCIKYAATSDFKIPLLTRWAMRRDSRLLAEASPSRLTEEFMKILGSGKSGLILRSLEDFGLLTHMLPAATTLLSKGAAAREAFYSDLAELDALCIDPAKEKRMSLLLAHYLKAFLDSFPEAVSDTPEAYQDALRESRGFLAPLNLPRVELEAAVLIIFKKRGISPLQRPRRPGPERGHGMLEHPGRGGEGHPGDGRGHDRGRGSADRIAPRTEVEPKPDGTKHGSAKDDGKAGGGKGNGERNSGEKDSGEKDSGEKDSREKDSREKVGGQRPAGQDGWGRDSGPQRGAAPPGRGPIMAADGDGGREEPDAGGRNKKRRRHRRSASGGVEASKASPSEIPSGAADPSVPIAPHPKDGGEGRASGDDQGTEPPRSNTSGAARRRRRRKRRDSDNPDSSQT